MAFARLPDITLYFDVAQDVAASRVLTGRAKIKYYEAGMDLGLASSTRESFRIFQGRIAQEYERMVVEYGFTRIDASQPIELQQEQVRRIVASHFDIADFKWPRDMARPVSQYQSGGAIAPCRPGYSTRHTRDARPRETTRRESPRGRRRGTYLCGASMGVDCRELIRQT